MADLTDKQIQKLKDAMLQRQRLLKVAGRAFQLRSTTINRRPRAGSDGTSSDTLGRAVRGSRPITL